MEVGVRELRAGLSRFLQRVKEGEEIVVTERGKPVARIVPEKEPSAWERLVSSGAITPAKRPKTSVPRPIKADGTVSDLVIEGRR